MTAPDDVVRVVVDLADQLQTASGTSSSIIVVFDADGDGPLVGAATEAVRGFVQAAALDLASNGARCNLVLASNATEPADIEAAVTYLDDDAGAIAVGMTIDLRPT